MANLLERGPSLSEGFIFPTPPTISEERLNQCRETGDYAPILFEWYKHVGLMANLTASIHPDSEAFRDIERLHCYVLIGLLNRCSRLMLSVVALSHEGLFGETTAIVDRCIFETCIKIIWLCKNDDASLFIRYLAEGLKTEVEFEQHIRENIKNRGGIILPIETRMLKSISNHYNAAGLTPDKIQASKKLPDLASMLHSIGSNRLLYVIGQRIGSHHIHGTWPSLLHHYLIEEDGHFLPRDHDCATDINQYAFISMTVIEAMRAYAEFIIDSEELNRDLQKEYEIVHFEIHSIFEQAGGVE